MSELELTYKDRVFLSNQLRILEKLYPEQAEDYEKYRVAIEHGYTRHYGDLTQHIFEEMPSDACEEVTDILNMFEVLNNSFDDLTDKADIKKSELRFLGFSGNDETDQLGYADYVMTELGWFPSLKGNRQSLNSHFPFMASYRRMLRVWLEMERPYQMTAEQIKQVLAAAPHPG